MSSWRVIEENSLSPSEQMALDEALFNSFQGSKKECPGIFRFYTFNKNSVTFGNLQVYKNIPQKYKDLYRLTRRLTAGGLVDHNGSLTFTIITSKKFHPDFASIGISYRKMHQILKDAFSDCGVLVSLKEGKDLRKSVGHFQQCFEEPVCSDILYKNKYKIVGGAQKRSKEFILNQTSLALHLIEEPFNVLDFQASVVTRLQHWLGNSFIKSDLTNIEVEAWKKLTVEKYLSKQWIQRM